MTSASIGSELRRSRWLLALAVPMLIATIGVDQGLIDGIDALVRVARAEPLALASAKSESYEPSAWGIGTVLIGHKDYATLSRRPISARLRRDPRFQNVLKQMEQAVATMRERSTVLAELRTMPFPAVPR